MAVNPTALGTFSVGAGTPVRLSTTRIPCQAFMIQAAPTNDAIGAVGNSSVSYATGAAIMGYIGVPTSTVIPAFSSRHAYAPGAFNLADIWLDCASGTQKFIVVYVQ